MLFQRCLVIIEINYYAINNEVIKLLKIITIYLKIIMTGVKGECLKINDLNKFSRLAFSHFAFKMILVSNLVTFLFHGVQFWFCLGNVTNFHRKVTKTSTRRKYV